ncbi:flagellar hook-length control protein FliK [Pandoraea pnomenusa]|uniref:flagellar hook-length control protein FliK n=1 Tax=Pandoraea pnomenusa TaxID=93220 RepID=UPI003340B4E9
MIAEFTPLATIVGHGSPCVSSKAGQHATSRDDFSRPGDVAMMTDFTATLSRSLAAAPDASERHRLAAVDPDTETPAQATPPDAVGVSVPIAEIEATPVLSEVSIGVDSAVQTSTGNGIATSTDVASQFEEGANNGTRTPALVPDDGRAHALRDHFPDDFTSPSIETLLVAHRHRMRGALETRAVAPTVTATNDGDMSSDAHLVQATERPTSTRAASVQTLLPGTGRHGGSLASLLAMPAPVFDTERGTPQPPVVDDPSNPIVRGAFPGQLSASAIVRDALGAATQGERIGAHVIAGDGAAVARTLAERVSSMTSEGVHEARLRLMPDELGDIDIVVRKSAMQLRVTLQVARPEVLGLVQGTAALLRDMLSQRHAGEVHVSTGAMTGFDGDGAPGDTSKRRHSELPQDDANPGLALGASAHGGLVEQGVFRL